MIRIPSSARSLVCCARLRLAVRPATSSCSFSGVQVVFGGQRSRKKNFTVLESGHFHTLYGPRILIGEPHLTRKGSHDHGVCPSFCQGSGIRPSRLFGALRRHWVRWDLRLAPRLRVLAANLAHLRFSWVYDLELFSTQLPRQSCVALR
jgi:hypothetical protein